MKITALNTQIVNLNFRNCVIVEVETDAGISGISETVMKRKTRTIEQSILQMRNFLLGKDPTEIESLWEQMYRDSFWVGGPMHATAISAVDCALWDILAKSCNVPVYKLHGGPTRTEVLVYCHCASGSRPEEFAQNVKECAARGYEAVKTTLPLFYGARQSGAAGYSGTRGAVDRHWKETDYLDPGIFRAIREFFVAAREAGGLHLGIAVDCHGRLGVKAAMRLCRALEDLDLRFIEEPTPPENADALAIVHRETSIPIAAGERWSTIYGVREFIEKQAVDVLQCDLVNCGGFSGMKKIAALAEAHYIAMAPHNPNGPMATVMNLHFAASVSNFQILESIGSEEDRSRWKEFLGQDLPLKNGRLAVPRSPGFGISLNQEALSQHPYCAREGWR